MAFVKRKGESYQDSDVVIEGRPDLFGPNRRFCVTEMATFPPYVFSIRSGSCLVHRVAGVEAHWWRVTGPGGSRLVRVNRPLMIAHTVCSTFFRLEAQVARTCKVPAPDALLCGRCHGEPATFGKHGVGTKARIPRKVAHVKLGCVVQGY